MDFHCLPHHPNSLICILRPFIIQPFQSHLPLNLNPFSPICGLKVPDYSPLPKYNFHFFAFVYTMHSTSPHSFLPKP